MLSEARARLANTQGKKAKRKAREKQMDESRRLAGLQKRRELKAAGIETALQKPKKYEGMMDYNADIPFHHTQPAGFFNISKEVERERTEHRDVTNSLLSKLDGKRRMDVEEEERKRDFKKQKAAKESGTFVPPKAILSKELVHSARKSFVLPQPVVGEAELLSYVKQGMQQEMARELVGDQTPSTALLDDTMARFENTPLRTPRIATATDNLKQQARNLKAMTESQTPLLGAPINLEGDGTFLSTPMIAAATPNPVLNRGITAGTPRDIMGINTPRSVHEFDETPRSRSEERRVGKECSS